MLRKSDQPERWSSRATSSIEPHRVNWDRSLLALKLQSIDRSGNFGQGFLTRPSTKDVGETRHPFRLRSFELELGGANQLHALRGLAFCVQGFGAGQDRVEARP